MTSPSTAGGLHVSTVGEVFIKLFAEVGILRGSVIGSVKGTGHLTGATRLLTSNLEIRLDQATGDETQVLRLFRP